MSTTNVIQNHINYSADDYAYLVAKGWTDEQIVARWDQEAAGGTGPCLWQRSDDEGDPVLGTFLNFLAKDIAEHPQRVKAIDTSLAERMRSLTKDITVDLDAALDPADE